MPDTLKMPILRVVPRTAGGWCVEEQTHTDRWWPVAVTMTEWGARWKMARIVRRWGKFLK